MKLIHLKVSCYLALYLVTSQETSRRFPCDEKTGKSYHQHRHCHSPIDDPDQETSCIKTNTLNMKQLAAKDVRQTPGQDPYKMTCRDHADNENNTSQHQLSCVVSCNFSRLKSCIFL